MGSGKLKILLSHASFVSFVLFVSFKNVTRMLSERFFIKCDNAICNFISNKFSTGRNIITLCSFVVVNMPRDNFARKITFLIFF